MLKFNIDDVEFEIGEPSDMFKVMFHHISDDDNFEWENIHTIKLKNVDKKCWKVISNMQYILYISLLHQIWWAITHKSISICTLMTILLNPKK